MQPQIANLVHPVFHHALGLKRRLERREEVDLATEQVLLKSLLLPEGEARRWVDFGGEDPRDQGPSEGEGANAGPRVRFLGIRYALVCWLDEIFTLDPVWGSQWNERKLEADLYGTNDRAWKFWEQAELADSRPEIDALTVYFLCVMLGFLGKYRDQPDESLTAWIAAAKTRIAKVSGQEAAAHADIDPPTNVPPLHGREQLKRMVLVGGLALLILIPVVAFFVVQRLGQ